MDLKNIDLTHKKNNSNLLKQALQGFVTSTLIYIFLIILLQNLPIFFYKEGILNHFFSFSESVKSKAFEVSFAMQEKNLALNFLGNIRKLSFQEAKIFQSSGLLHLLAISGGQVVPIATGISTFIGYIFYKITYKSLSPLSLMKSIYHIKTITSLFLSFLVCHLFGCTGALIRVSALTYSLKIKCIHSQHSVFYPYIPFITVSSFNRFFVLIFIAIIFGNIFQNFSFILSAIGASCAEISIYISYYFIKNSKFLLAISSTVLTSFFTGAILYPFSELNLLNSCMANIIALPIVCFLITPLSLLILFTPKNFIIFEHLIKFLDISLSLLKKTAFVFYEPFSHRNPFDKNNLLFTLEGIIYLNTILIILWVFIDVFKERKIYLARSYFYRS